MKKRQSTRTSVSRHPSKPSAEKAKQLRGESERLFLSFWDIRLDNLPQGAFTHRRLAPEEAREYIEEADKRQALACVSADDLLAPYRKHELEKHKECAAC